jgi:hypothetical protein
MQREYVYNTQTFALDSTVSGFNLYSSSMRAGRNVPDPWTSLLSAAHSAATVRAKTLVDSQFHFSR